jgi:hypothetical protein
MTVVIVLSGWCASNAALAVMLGRRAGGRR